LQMQEVEAWFKETVRRYGDRLSDQQRSRIRRILVQNQRMLAPVRDFPVDNGDGPATTLKLRIDNSSPARTHTENGRARMVEHAR
jgi:hypothetical protein